MKNPKKYYLVGICGTAMASLAGMLKSKGYLVSGSDSDVYPPMSTYLDELGIRVYNGYKSENLLDAAPDIVVIGNAVSRGNPEVEQVLDSGIRYQSMAETVKELFIRGKNSIVVSGTHGKTTTTAMLAWVLEVARRKPSFLVGGIAENFGGSFQIGKGREFVIEGDEYDTAFFDKGPKFLHYLPQILLLKNIEYDHADIYPDIESLKIAFRRVINIVPRSGLIIAGVDSPIVRELIPAAFSRVAQVGIQHGDWRARDIAPADEGMSFRVFHEDVHVGDFTIPMLGAFNVQNALGVIVAGKELGIENNTIQKGLSSFKSVKRRLELRGEVERIRVYDDFAHHPTAVLETLRAIRERYPTDRVWAVFEPRSQTCRRKIFEQEFIKSFDPADMVVVARVFASGKLAEDEQLSPDAVVEGVRARGKIAETFDTTDEIVEYVSRNATPGDQIVVMSNGGFDGIHRKLLDRLKGR
jgi:UDP-N-acetylmuramate: L-alanyl-gamma-D-glutamyl-meso-diaminopimelate ligase